MLHVLRVKWIKLPVIGISLQCNDSLKLTFHDNDMFSLIFDPAVV